VKDYPEALEVHVYQNGRYRWWANVYFPKDMCTDTAGNSLTRWEPNFAWSRRGALRLANKEIARRKARINDEIIHR
jgi:hypothetical protein